MRECEINQTAPPFPWRRGGPVRDYRRADVRAGAAPQLSADAAHDLYLYHHGRIAQSDCRLSGRPVAGARGLLCHRRVCGRSDPALCGGDPLHSTHDCCRCCRRGGCFCGRLYLSLFRPQASRRLSGHCYAGIRRVYALDCEDHPGHRRLGRPDRYSHHRRQDHIPASISRLSAGPMC